MFCNEGFEGTDIACGNPTSKTLMPAGGILGKARARDSPPRNTQMLAIVSHPALYSGLVNQFLRIFEPALPDFYPFFFTWKNYAKVQRILDMCKFLGNFFSNKNDI